MLLERELEKLLKVLANKRRLAILKYLKGNKEESVGTIADHINLSLKSTSKHLGLLITADILEKEQRSLRVFYSLTTKQQSIVMHVISLL